MKKIKLGDVLDVRRGTSLAGEYYSEQGNLIRLTLGNFNYPRGGFQDNTSKKNIYFVGSVNPAFILKAGDIITPLTEQVSGLLGETATIPESDKYVQSGDIGLVIPDETKIDKRFAYYLVSSPVVRKQLDAAAQQTKIRHTSPDAIKACEAWIPENISTQRNIGKILDALDEKIALNKKINATLEAMTKTLYDYWFVQFDFPDENGKPYKTSGGKMIYSSELGRDIPASWERGKLSKLIKSVTTGLNPRDNFILNTSGNIKYVTVKNLTLEGRIDFSNCDCVNEDARNLIHERSNISKGDVLFASISPLGRCFLIQEDPCNWEINESVFSIRPSNFTTSEFLYMYLKSNSFVKLASSSSTGSIFKGIRINTLMETPTIIPPKNISEQFKSKLFKLLSKLNQSNKESHRLAALRDWLLPMLMNGQVNFKEI